MDDTTTVTGYAHWASFLINGDPSGLSEEDFAECQAWLAYHGNYDYSCHDVARDESGDVSEYFGHPDMPGALAGTVIDYIFFAPEE